MEISIEKQAQAILDQKINELRSAGFLVKQPEVEVYSSPVSDDASRLNVVVKINVEMYVPDKFIRVKT